MVSSLLSLFFPFFFIFFQFFFSFFPIFFCFCCMILLCLFLRSGFDWIDVVYVEFPRFPFWNWHVVRDLGFLVLFDFSPFHLGFLDLWYIIIVYCWFLIGWMSRFANSVPFKIVPFFLALYIGSHFVFFSIACVMKWPCFWHSDQIRLLWLAWSVVSSFNEKLSCFWSDGWSV